MVEYFIIEKFSISYSEFSIKHKELKKTTNNEKSNPIEFELKPGMKQKLRYVYKYKCS